MKLKKILISGAIVTTLALVGYRINASAEQEVVKSIPKPPVKVEVFQIQPVPLASWAFAEGTAEALQKAYLNFEQSGKVVFIGNQLDGSQLREGSRVFGPSEGAQLGQLLARIDNRENTAEAQAVQASLQSSRERRKEADANLDRAKNDFRQAQNDFARIEKIFKKGVVSRDEYDRYNTNLLNAESAVEAAESGLKAAWSEEKSATADFNRASVSLEKTGLFAPFDGVITSMNVLEDNYYYPPAGVTSGREREASSAIVVVDDSRFEIKLEVSEEYARQIKEGQTVYLASEDRKLYEAADKDFDHEGIVKGTVWSVSPSISLQRRSQLVKVRTEGHDPDIQDGMFMRAWIATEEKKSALALPWQSVSFRDGRPYVFVINDQNMAEQRWLDLGLQGLENIEVMEGLHQGDRIVTTGQHLLTEGSEVKIQGAVQ